MLLALKQVKRVHNLKVIESFYNKVPEIRFIAYLTPARSISFSKQNSCANENTSPMAFKKELNTPIIYKLYF